MSSPAPAPLTVETVKQFSDLQLQSAIERAMARLSVDKKGAFVAHVDGDGASVSAVERIGPHVSIELAAFYPWKGELEGMAEVVGTW